MIYEENEIKRLNKIRSRKYCITNNPFSAVGQSSSIFRDWRPGGWEGGNGGMALLAVNACVRTNTSYLHKLGANARDMTTIR